MDGHLEESSGDVGGGVNEGEPTNELKTVGQSRQTTASASRVTARSLEDPEKTMEKELMGGCLERGTVVASVSSLLSCLESFLPLA